MTAETRHPQRRSRYECTANECALRLSAHGYAPYRYEDGADALICARTDSVKHLFRAGFEHNAALGYRFPIFVPVGVCQSILQRAFVHRWNPNLPIPEPFEL